MLVERHGHVLCHKEAVVVLGLQAVQSLLLSDA